MLACNLLLWTSSPRPCVPKKVRLARSAESVGQSAGGGGIPFREVLEEAENAVILKLASASLVNSVQSPRKGKTNRSQTVSFALSAIGKIIEPKSWTCLPLGRVASFESHQVIN